MRIKKGSDANPRKGGLKGYVTEKEPTDFYVILEQTFGKSPERN